MLPAGGVKGAMLALIVELLACALTGSHFGFETESFFVDEGGPARLGQAFMAIDPGALAGNDAYLERVETLVDVMLEDEHAPARRPPPQAARRGAQARRGIARGADGAAARHGGRVMIRNAAG